MAIHMEDDRHVQFITDLKQELQVIINRESYEFKQSQLRQMGASFLADINEKFTNQNELIRNLAAKWANFLDSWTQMKEDYQDQIADLNDQVEYKSISIDNIQEVLNHLESKTKIYEEQYEKLKIEYHNISQKLQNQEKEHRSEKKELKQALREAIQQSEKYKHIVSKMSNEKEILLDQIKHERSINKDVVQQMELIKKKLEAEEKNCKNESHRADELIKVNQRLECYLEQQKEIIERMQGELRSRKKSAEIQKITAYDPFTTVESDIQYEPPACQNMKKSIRLDDDIPFNEQISSYEFRRRLSEVNYHDLQNHKENIYRNLDEDTMNPVLKMTLDPYFSHFVLTSQSVKIKQDCEELLNIDIKPYYKQIVEKRIPMHLWDQWIRNRLRELLKKIKAAEMDEDDDQQ